MMIRSNRLAAFAIGALLWVMSSVSVFAQTSPGWTYGYVPTTAQWNAIFASKQNYLGAPPVLVTGGIMTGKLSTVASTTGSAGFGLPPGVAPTSPVDGDTWTTTSGMFVRINGATVGPLASSLSTILTVGSTVIAGGSSGYVLYNNSGTLGNLDTTGSGSVVRAASPSLTGAVTITSASAAALAVGLAGATNPAFVVDASTASQVAGLKVTGAVTGGTVAIAAIDSGSNANLSINAKGSGTISLGNTSTGAILVPNGTIGVGSAGVVVGQIVFGNLTSGAVTIKPVTGALSGTLSIPAITDTLAGVALANGGTNNALTASNGGIVYSDASKLAILAGTVTAGQCVLSGSNAAPTWGSCAGAAAVSSVANSDSTLTISPTTGSVVASLNLSHANTWAAVQTFPNNDIRLIGSSTGYTVFASANAGASNFTVTFPATTGTVAMTSGVVSSIAGNVGDFTLSTGLTNSTNAILIDKATSANYYAATSNKVVTTDVIYPSEVTVTFGSTTTFDFDTFIDSVVTLTGNITTQTLSNIRAGKSGTIRFVQDGTGSRTTVWNTNFKWASGTTPTLTTTASAIDVLTYSCQTATYCSAALIKDVR